MIGRYARLGVYKELARQRKFYVIGLAGLLALAAFLMDLGRPAPGPAGELLALAAVALGGLPIIYGAFRGLLERRVNVDELVSLAIAASLLRGEFLTAAVVSFVMTLGALIEEATSDSARKAIRSLAELSPEKATVLFGRQPRVVPVEEVRPGQMILIKPGERVPVDAVIRTGLSAVDESSVTGEPLPREKGPGDTVLAGTLNHNGVLEAEVTGVGRDTTLGRVIALVAEAESFRPEAVRLIDRYARWFTPAILLCAGAAWVLTGDPDRAVAVLIVGCPCALILAAPTATVAALARSARAGVLVKGGRYLEKAAEVKSVLFDKTGTLTSGRPRVEEISCLEGLDVSQVLACAAGAEKNCNHPLARAVLLAAEEAGLDVPEAEEVISEIGLGVRARVDGSLIEVLGINGGGPSGLSGSLGDCLDRVIAHGATPMIVRRDELPIGVIGVTDQVRPTAGPAVKAFRALGLKHLAMLSGDHAASAQRTAGQIGLEEVHAGLKPEDKLVIIRREQAQGRPVMYVGDGINDAPALAAADVGVAMGAAGTEVALETADVALIHDDVSQLPFLIKLGRRTIWIIKANIAFGLAFNAAAVVASGSGLLTPIAAAITHNIGSVLVVLASASLAFYKDPEGTF